MGSSTIQNWREYPIAVLVSSFVGLGAFLIGYDAGVISGILDMDYFKERFGHIRSDGTYQLNSNDKSLIVSMLFVGTFCGSLLAYPCGDFLGRRWGIILGYAIFLIGVVFETVAMVIPIFIVGRTIAGVGLGLATSVILMYQSECAPKSIRGAIVSTFQWFMTIGLLIAAIVVNVTKDISFDACYKIPISIQLIWGIAFAIGVFFVPESPRYLVLKGHIDQAYKSQARLISSEFNDPQVKADIEELIENTKLMKMYGSHSVIDCFKMGPQKNLLRTLVGIFVTLLQQISGIYFIFYYGTSSFSSSGVSNSFMIIIIIHIINVLMTIPGILLIDKLGRRYMLIIGAIGMSISEYIIAITGAAIGQTNETVQNIFIVFSCVYVAFFAATWGPTTWVIIGEIYPISIQAKCISLSSALGWLFCFGINYATPFMIDQDKGNLGTNIFFIWGSTCLASLIFAIFCIWETKGLSLEQINYLIRNSSPIKSAKLNRQLKTLALIENDTSSVNVIPNFLNKSLNSANEISPISTDMDKSNENTSLLRE